MDIEKEEQIKNRLNELIESHSYREIKSMLKEENAVDLAGLLSDINDEALAKVFRLLPKELASDTFIEMDAESQEYLIASFSDVELKEIIDDLFVDDTVDLIEEMPAHIVKRIIKSAERDVRESINKILNYPRDSAGSIMTTEYVNLESNMTVEQAITRIRRTGIDKETIYSCYVTDKQNHLIGIVSVRTLLLAQNTDLIGDIMQDNVIFGYTHDDKEKISQEINKYSFLALPIVDNEKRLVGIVTIDDAMDILRKEQVEDISIMSGAKPLQKSYLKTSVFRIWLSRMPWLLLLMLTATLTSLVITGNPEVLNSEADIGGIMLGLVLTASIPMLMDTGGNAGSQASATIISEIAMDRIKFSDIFKVLFKELRAATLLAASLSAVAFGKLMLIDGFFRYSQGALIALVISLSLFITVVSAKLIGCVLPLVAKKLKVDPAVLSGPLITSIVDTLSLIIYCQLAVSMLASML